MRTTVLTCCFLVLAPALVPAAETSVAKLSATQVVEKNVGARGGLQAWRAVKTLSWSGKMDAGGNNRPTLAMPGQQVSKSVPKPKPRPTEQVQLPFTLEMKRPRQSRLEIIFNGQTAVQVYDGKQGWKLRPFLNRHEVEPYTAEEMKAAAMQADLDGPLMDYAAKGSSVDVEGTEDVEGHPAYVLKVTQKDRNVLHVWIDAKSFLELKIDGVPRRLDGKPHAVSIYLRDFRTVGGLVMPFVYETMVQGVKGSEKINIDKIVVNPDLPDSRFAKPQ
jgi:outer membrane lipoprotein-sorting protein